MQLFNSPLLVQNNKYEKYQFDTNYKEEKEEFKL